MTIKFLLTSLLVFSGDRTKDQLAELLVLLIIITCISKELGRLVKAIDTNRKILLVEINKTGIIYREKMCILHIPQKFVVCSMIFINTIDDGAKVFD